MIIKFNRDEKGYETEVQRVRNITEQFVTSDGWTLYREWALQLREAALTKVPQNGDDALRILSQVEAIDRMLKAPEQWLVATKTRQ